MVVVVIVVVFLQFYVFLFSEGLVSGNRLSLHDDILNLLNLQFFPTLYVAGLLFSRP